MQYHWTSLYSHRWKHYSVGSDLQQEALKRPLADIAVDMRLVGGPSEFRKPLNVGLMFFSEDPERFFDYARIEIVDKPDPTGIGMTEKLFTGPLNRQLRDALSWNRFGPDLFDRSPSCSRFLLAVFLKEVCGKRDQTDLSHGRRIKIFDPYCLGRKGSIFYLWAGHCAWL